MSNSIALIPGPYAGKAPQQINTSELVGVVFL